MLKEVMVKPPFEDKDNEGRQNAIKVLAGHILHDSVWPPLGVKPWKLTMGLNNYKVTYGWDFSRRAASVPFDSCHVVELRQVNSTTVRAYCNGFVGTFQQPGPFCTNKWSGWEKSDAIIHPL
jgi:hypothetical protein